MAGPAAGPAGAAGAACAYTLFLSSRATELRSIYVIFVFISKKFCIIN